MAEPLCTWGPLCSRGKQIQGNVILNANDNDPVSLGGQRACHSTRMKKPWDINSLAQTKCLLYFTAFFWLFLKWVTVLCVSQCGAGVRISSKEVARCKILHNTRSNFFFFLPVALCAKSNWTDSQFFWLTFYFIRPRAIWEMKAELCAGVCACVYVWG